MKRVRVLLAVATSFTLLVSAQAKAQGAVCRDLFESQNSASTSTSPSLLTRLISMRGSASKFNADLFKQEKLSYEKALRSGETPNAPQSPEASLALFEASARVRGRSDLTFETWLKTASNSDKRNLLRPFLKFRPGVGLKPSQLEEVFTRFYLMTHADPRTLSELYRNGIPQSLKNLVTQRFEQDSANHSIQQTFSEMGLLRAAGKVAKLRQAGRAMPEPVRFATSAAVDLVSLHFMSAAGPNSYYRILDASNLPPGLKARAKQNGFESVRAELMAHYVNRAKFELAWHWGRRVVVLTWMAFALEEFLVEALESQLPPDTAVEDLTLLQLVQEVVAHYKWMYEITQEIEIGTLPDLGSDTQAGTSHSSEPSPPEVDALLKELEDLSF